VYRPFDEIGYMQLVLTDDGIETLSIVLPDATMPHEKRLKASLLAEELELDFLIAGRYARLQFQYVDESYFFGSRKMKLVDDQRGAQQQ
jgi:hypothetical protein